MLVTLGSLGVKRLKLQFLSLNGILIHRKLPPAPPPPKEVCHASTTIHRHQISDSEKNIPLLLFSDFYPIFFI